MFPCNTLYEIRRNLLVLCFVQIFLIIDRNIVMLKYMFRENDYYIKVYQTLILCHIKVCA